MFKNTYKKKVRALLEGLECEHIDMFMSSGKTGDYRKLGKAYAKRTRELINK